MTVYKWEAGIEKENGMLAGGDKKLHVASYCRVSTDDQDSSYEAQKNHFMDLLEQHPEWELAGIYADEGISGTGVKHRKEFLKMLRDCESGGIDLIITKSVSRFARNTVDMLLAVRRLRDLDINVVFEKENLDTRDSANELFLTFWASFAQAESISISKNVVGALQGRMARGEGRVNCWATIGYEKAASGTEMTIVPGQAVLVRRIFREYLEGFSEAMICSRLMKDGVPSPKGGKTWYGSTVASILENPKYLGDLLFQRTYTKDTLTHKVEENKGQLPQYYYPGHHEPVVPREIFYMAQGERMRRAALRGSTDQPYMYREPFHNHIFCGICGRVLKAVRYHDGAVEFRCKRRALSKKTFSKENAPSCECPSIKESTLREVFLYALAKIPDYKGKIVEYRNLCEEKAVVCRDLPDQLMAAEETRTAYRKNKCLYAGMAENTRKILHLRTLEMAADIISRTVMPCEDDGSSCTESEDFFKKTGNLMTFSKCPWDRIRECIKDTLIYTSYSSKSKSDGSNAGGPTLLKFKESILEDVPEQIISDENILRFLDNMVVYPQGIEVFLRGGIRVMVNQGDQSGQSLGDGSMIKTCF